MKNKNLIFAMFLLGIVLMSSFAIAGITGYVLQLERGETVTDDNLGTTTVIDVSRTGVATFEVVDPNTGIEETLFGRPGQTLTTASGTEVIVQSATPRTLFRKPRVEISVSPNLPTQVSPIAGTATGAGGNALCNVCTEKFQVDEGQTISVDGSAISIDFIDSSKAVLNVNGVNTNLLSKGQTFTLSNGQIVTLDKVIKLEVGGTIGRVKLCSSGCYKIKELETITMGGDTISIDFINANSAVLLVNGVNTNLLSNGQTFTLSNGQIVTLDKVIKLEVGGTIGEVKVCSSSSY